MRNRRASDRRSYQGAAGSSAGLVLHKSRMVEVGSVPTTTRYALRCEPGRSAQVGDDRAVSLVRLDQL